MLISDDAAGGGPNDVDAVVAYTAADLDLTGLTPHPKQGYHLKVTLRTDAPGGVKHKVFWLEPCAEAAVTGGETPGTGGTGGAGAVSTPAAPETSTANRTQVLGTTQGSPVAAVLTAMGALLVALGALLVTAGTTTRSRAAALR